MGEYIDAYAARTAGQFDLREADGAEIRKGDEIVIVQRVYVNEYSVRELANGDNKQVMVFKPLETGILSEALKQSVLPQLGMSSTQQGSLFEIEPTAEEKWAARVFTQEEEIGYDVPVLTVDTESQPIELTITDEGYLRLKEDELGLPVGALDGTQQAQDGAINVWVHDDGVIGRCTVADTGREYWVEGEWFNEDEYQAYVSEPEPAPAPVMPKPRVSTEKRRAIKPTKDAKLAGFLEGR